MVNKALLGYEVSNLKETAKMAPLAQPTPPPATATHPSAKRKFPTTPPPQLPATAPPRPPSIAKTAASTPEASATLAPKPGQSKPPLPTRPAPKPPSKPATLGKPLPLIPQAYRERLVQKRRSDPPEIKQAREELQHIYRKIDTAKQFPSHERLRKHISTLETNARELEGKITKHDRAVAAESSKSTLSRLAKRFKEMRKGFTP